MCSITSFSTQNIIIRKVKKMNVFVGCSSSALQPEVYKTSCDVAKQIARWIVANHHNFVFGASSNGLMGVIYHEIRKYHSNSKIIAVTLKYWAQDLDDLECDNSFILDNLQERKKVLFDNSDILIFLPGRTGTIDELLSAIFGKISNEHEKEIIIFNPYGYFDLLIHSINEGFGGKRPENLFHLASTEQQMMSLLSLLGSI